MNWPKTMQTSLPSVLYYTTITEVEGIKAGYTPAECGEFDYVEDLLDFERALRSLGIEPRRLGYGAALVDDLLTIRPPLLWNLNSGLIGEVREAQVPSLCEMIGIPIVGPGAWNAALTQDKSLCSLWVKHKVPGIEVPKSLHIMSGDDVSGKVEKLIWPATYIIKPNNEDSSRGLDDECLQSTPRGVCEQILKILTEWGSVRVEEYIDGYDVSANLACKVGGDLLALEPVRLSTARGVYDEPSRLAGGFERSCLKESDPQLAARIKELAMAIGHACRFHEYARLDMRVQAKTGEVFFLEANITPSFDINGDYVFGALALGLTFKELLQNILSSAWHRATSKLPPLLRPLRLKTTGSLW